MRVLQPWAFERAAAKSHCCATQLRGLIKPCLVCGSAARPLSPESEVESLKDAGPLRLLGVEWASVSNRRLVGEEDKYIANAFAVGAFFVAVISGGLALST